jgi:hypothetical protein
MLLIWLFTTKGQKNIINGRVSPQARSAVDAHNKAYVLIILDSIISQIILKFGEHIDVPSDIERFNVNISKFLTSLMPRFSNYGQRN